MSIAHPGAIWTGEPTEPSDVELMAAVRAGNVDAYGRLYERHVASARQLANQLTRSSAEADDVTSEAFAKVLQTLLNGGGPGNSFRSYLLTTLRNTLYDRIRRDRRVELSDDMTRHDPGVPWEDTAVARLESSLAARAFNRLPERWQTVLWHTEVEQESPAQVAPLLGLTPNGVAALAYRAREGLRQAYLREHVGDGAGGRCQWAVERLGVWARDALSARERAKVDDHLARCDRCRPLGAELRDVNGGLRGIIAPLVLGPAAAAYLSSSAARQAAVTGGGAAGAGAASAGGSGAAGAAGTGGMTGAGASAAGSAGTTAAGTAAGPAAAGTTAAGSATGSAAGTAAGSTAAGTAAAGSAAGTAAAGTAAGSAAVSAAGGSVPAAVASWATGTAVGKAAAAAVTAVVLGGAAVGIGVGTSPTESRADVPSVVEDAGSSGTGVPEPGDVDLDPGRGIGTSRDSGLPVLPAGSGAPTQSRRPVPDPSGPPASGDGGSTAEPEAPGTTPAVPDQPASPHPSTGGPAGTAGPPPAQAELAADPAVAARPLRAGKPGEITIEVRNTGSAAAAGVVATVQLPAGFTVRAGSDGGKRAGWACGGSGSVATCQASSLSAGSSDILRVKVVLDAGAVTGEVSGQVSADGTSTAIPAAVVPVSAR